MNENIPTSLNNPGDLRYIGQQGAAPSPKGFAQFQNPQQGFAALLNDTQTKINNHPDWTLADFAKVYAPASDGNNPAQYAASLANQLGVAPDATLKQIEPNIGKFAEAIAHNEGYQGPTGSGQQTQQPQQQPQQPQPQVVPGQPTQPEQAPPQKGGLLDAITNGLETIFPGTKQIGESIGTAAYNIGQLIQGKNPFVGPAADLSKVNIPQTIGGYLEAGSTAAAPAVGGETALGRIAGTAGLGALTGAGSGLAQTGTLPGAAQGAATGGLLGGALGSVGEVLAKAANYLPFRLTRTFLPGTSPETAQYAVDKGLGSPRAMFNRSTQSLAKIGNTIQDVLNHPELSNVTATANDVYQPIIQRFSDAGLTPEEVSTQLQKLIPLQKGLISKLETEGLNAADLNRLKTALGKATYKTVFDEPAVKAGKDLGNAGYAAISKWLENKVPDAAPLFNEYSKELQLNKALTQALRRGEKARPFTLRDILALMGGLSAVGPVGALGALGAEKALTNPSINLRAAGLVSGLAGPTAGMLGKLALPSVVSGTMGGQSR